jgi:hypothetical protein
VLLKDMGYKNSIYDFFADYHAIYLLGKNRMYLPFDVNVFNTVYDYANIIANTTDYDTKLYISTLFYLLFNGCRRFNDIIW